MTQENKQQNRMFDGPSVFVKVEIAALIGLPEAMFLGRLDYWLQHSKNIEDGYAWCYKTYDEWAEELIYTKPSNIKRIVTKLEKDGYIITGNYNKMKLDKTKWYRINYEFLNKKVDEYRQTSKYPSKGYYNSHRRDTTVSVDETLEYPSKGHQSDEQYHIITSLKDNHINTTGNDHLRHASSIYIYYKDSVNTSLTKLQEQQIDHWLEHVTVDMLKHGINRVVEHSPEKPFNYLKSIVERWMRDGVQSLAQVQNDDERYERIKARNKNRNQPSGQQQQMQFDGGLHDYGF